MHDSNCAQEGINHLEMFYYHTA